MKKNSIACLLMLMAFSSFAQSSKKQFLVGGFGDFSYANQSSKYPAYSSTNKLTTLGISADGGYFFADRFCAGLRFSGSLNNLNQQTNSVTYQYVYNGSGAVDSVVGSNIYKYASKTHSYGIAPFMRYYFLPATNKINILAELNYTYTFAASGYSTLSYFYFGTTTQNTNTAVNLNQSHSNAVGIQAGPAIFFNPKVAMEILLGYQYTTASHLTTNSFTIGAGFHAYLRKL